MPRRAAAHPGDVREAQIHFKLYSELEKLPELSKSLPFNRVEPEFPVSRKKADLVLFKDNSPFLVIECKRYQGTKVVRSIDPLSTEVISQAFGYAAELGAKYFVTYNGSFGALFQTHQEGVPLFERNSRIFRGVNHNHRDFAASLFNTIRQAQAGRAAWADFDERFIGRMASLHSLLVPHATDALAQHYSRRTDYIKSVRAWFESFGVEWDDAQVSTIKTRLLPSFATQAAYVFIDKLLFYKVLERKYDRIPKLHNSGTSKSIFAVIDDCFRAILNIDYESIFHPDTLFSRRDLFEECAEEISAFIKELNQIDLNRLDGDKLGRIYETLIPPDLRHNLGQYYTPPEICNLLVTWALKSETASVLDPGCGSGGFLTAAYDRLKKLKPRLSHEQILDRLHGIEINRFPAHLSAMNLALKNLEAHTNFLNVTVKDFFDTNVRDTVGNSKVDAVVGNPPYVRQELIPDKAKCRRHLGELADSIAARSDIYVYFITQSLKMLKEGGRLAFIVSNRWLQTEYGEKLQQYLATQCKSVGFVSLDKNAFDDALIGTVCIFIERSAPAKTDITRFVRLKKRMSKVKILKLLKTKMKEGKNLITDEYNIFAVSNEQLKQKDTLWRAFLYGPDLYHEIVRSDNLVKLSELANVYRGITSGKNDFFYLKKEQLNELGLDRRYVKPLIKSVGQLTATDFGRNDTEWLVLDLERFAAAAMASAGIEPRASGPLNEREREKVLRALRSDGHSELASYIKLAEQAGAHELPTVANRRVWWSLGKLEAVPFALTKECWREFRSPRLLDGMICDQHLYAVKPHLERDYEIEALGGILNSTLTWLMREVRGREASGQAMSRNEITVDEAQSLLVPDLRTAPREIVRAIAEDFRKLVAADRAGDQTAYKEARKRIDSACLRILESPFSPKHLQEAVNECVARRESAAHDDREIVVAA